MKAFIVLSLVLAVSAAPLKVASQFGEWKAAYGKRYASVDEEQQRLANFHTNYLKVSELNAAESSHPSGAHFKLNKYADWSAAELARLRGTRAKLSFRNASTTAEVPSIKAPSSVDWRTKGVLAPIQDQGQCGSCWAFSATATLEAQSAIKGGGVKKLSEQFLVDCDHHCGTYREFSGCDGGCNGGLQPNAWLYDISKRGQPSEASYPYRAVDGSCRSGMAPVTVPKTWEFGPTDEGGIATYVAAVGPVSIAVNAENWSFYNGGIMHTSSICPPTSNPWSTLDHGVNIVGYGAEGSMEYWLIRNSWGASWGESGYCRVLRGSNFCGINLFVCRAVM